MNDAFQVSRRTSSSTSSVEGETQEYHQNLSSPPTKIYHADHDVTQDQADTVDLDRSSLSHASTRWMKGRPSPVRQNVFMNSPALKHLDACAWDKSPERLDDFIQKCGKTAHTSSSFSESESPYFTDVPLELKRITRDIFGILQYRAEFIQASLQQDECNPKNDVDNNLFGLDEHMIAVKQSRNGCRHSVRKSSAHAGNCPRVHSESICEFEDVFLEFAIDDHGVYQVKSIEDSTELVFDKPVTFSRYLEIIGKILRIAADGPTKSFAYRQLDILEGKYQLYSLERSYQEVIDSKKVPHRDFYNVRKIDTHVHHSACMTQKHLLQFIKNKLRTSPSEIVCFRDGQELTLSQVFASINLTAYDLSIDTLDMHAHADTFHRFDKFNLKYNPVGESRLREIFLKTDNYIGGRYLAEITKEVISDLETSKHQFVEWRISIYGRARNEWAKLAAWVIDNHIFSPNVRWLIQIPRLYELFRMSDEVPNFAGLLMNIFDPLFAVTKSPNSDIKLHKFLKYVIGFDSVDDESKSEIQNYQKYPSPSSWDTLQNPPYIYWIYHLFANLTTLNQWRKRRDLNTFVLRPHCGEAGNIDHIAAAFICSHSISHGLLLRKTPVLQYLFYLDQVGIAMSPSSNNALFLSYDRNPFPRYFKRGLNISLSTDDPLQFAFTREPLIEEYSLSAQIYRLSAVDMCELARNSVLQSGFEQFLKSQWLGHNCEDAKRAAEQVAKTNVPNIRTLFRENLWRQEILMLKHWALFEPLSIKVEPSKSHTTLDDCGVRSGKAKSNHNRTRFLVQDETDGLKSRSLQAGGFPDSAVLPPEVDKDVPVFPGIVHKISRRFERRS